LFTTSYNLCLNLNLHKRQTFNKRFASSEKSPILQSHKSYKNPLWFISNKNLVQYLNMNYKIAKNEKLYSDFIIYFTDKL